MSGVAPTSFRHISQRDELNAYLRGQNLPAGVAQRVRIILRPADVATFWEIEEALDTTASTISLWKKSFQKRGEAGHRPTGTSAAQAG